MNVLPDSVYIDESRVSFIESCHSVYAYDCFSSEILQDGFYSDLTLRANKDTMTNCETNYLNSSYAYFD